MLYIFKKPSLYFSKTFNCMQVYLWANQNPQFLCKKKSVFDFNEICKTFNYFSTWGAVVTKKLVLHDKETHPKYLKAATNSFIHQSAFRYLIFLSQQTKKKNIEQIFALHISLCKINGKHVSWSGFSKIQENSLEIILPKHNFKTRYFNWNLKMFFLSKMWA